MDKYEYKVKLDQIEKLAAKKNYVTAAKIADGIDWRKVKSVTTLCMVADIYEATERLEDCYEILNMVYDRSPISRGVVYRLAELATKMHDFEEAIDLYKEFVRIAPHDLSKYILKYQIYRERGSSLADQIVILEEFKSHEYDEKWAYELACLYEEAGQISRCIEECDELILWFSEGEYVVKAMELKMKYQELTASQQEKYENRFEYLEKEAAEQEEYFDDEDEVSDGLPAVEIAAVELEPEEDADEDTQEEQEEISGKSAASERKEVLDENVPTERKESAVSTAETDDTPQVSMINTTKFSTMNLQEELAKGLQMILAQVEEEEADEKGDTQEFIPMKEAVPVEESAAEAQTDVPEAAAEETVEPEVAVVEEVSVVEEVAEEAASEVEEAALEDEEAVEEVKEEAQAQQAVETPKNEKLSETAELQSEILKYVVVKPERKMEELLRTEEDGQLSLAIGEENILEKQITGQMTIGEILEAWEEKKRQAREQIENSGDKKQAVLFETGEITNLLQDFIPRTPKDVQQMIEEIEAEEAAAETSAAETAEELAGETPAAETAEELAEETPVVEIAEEVLPEETLDVEPSAEEIPNMEEVVQEADTEPEELEDDLPQDIDLAEALEAVLEYAQENKVEEPAAEEPMVEELKSETVGQNTASMLDAIERALAMEIAPVETAGKYLTEEQEKIFAYFTSVNGMKKQLVTLLGEDHTYAGREDSVMGNLIITGHPGNGKTTLAIDIVKAFQKQRHEKGGKLAKVTGDGLNKKNPGEVVKKLGGGALIIERAGGLNDETVEKLSTAMEGTTGGLLVILEDDSKEINSLLGKHERFALKFNRSIDIPIFSNDELVAFGKSYAEEQEYYFDEMAVLALYDSIGVRQTADHVVNITEVKEFVDDAIAHAEKKSRGLFARLSKKRIDEYGNKLLLEEDFDY